MAAKIHDAMHARRPRKRAKTQPGVVVFSPASCSSPGGHDTRFDDGFNHQECPDRVRAILAAVRETWPDALIREGEPLGTAEFDGALAAVHDANYLASLQRACASLSAESTGALTPLLMPRELKAKGDTRFSANSYSTALAAMRATLEAVDHVTGDGAAAFVCVRPPGHHAGPRGPDDEVCGCGFCLVNHVAVAAYYAVHVKRHERVAVVDIDVHHGNGTERCVRETMQEEHVMYASLHLRETFADSALDFFPGTGASCCETAVGGGPWILNLPLEPQWPPPPCAGERSTARGQGRLAWRDCFERELLPVLDAFGPSLILVSAGFDGAAGDDGNLAEDLEHGGLDLLPDDFEWCARLLLRRAAVVSVLEGGYGCMHDDRRDYARLAACAVAHVRGLFH